MKRLRLSVLSLMVLVVLSACATGPGLRDKVDRIVFGSERTVETFKADPDETIAKFREMMPNAHAVMIFPGVIKGGFVFGGEYGNGVLLARLPGGGWSPPAFYTLATGSVGLQIGAEFADMVMVIRTPEALEAVLKHQGKLGAELDITVGTVGPGIEAATTANMGADLVVFSRAAGFFAGGSIEGAAVIRRNDYNAVYYGEGATPQVIVSGTDFTNVAADGLRARLGQF